MNRFSKVLLKTVSLPAIWLAVQMSQATAVPDGTIIATFHAEGAQVYECRQDSAQSASQPSSLTWQLREPVATLIIDGSSVGRHYAGPNWDHIDGSGVKGKVAVSAPGATTGDIAWLKLDVVEHRGSGILSDAAAVERINTRGGVAPRSCEVAGSYLSVPYSADYVFLRKG